MSEQTMKTNVIIGTKFSPTATKMLLCGAGELGKEVAIEAQRYGIEVIALDRYDNAPAMQVADKSYKVDMLDGEMLKKIIRQEKPDYVVPEIEAIATDALAKSQDIARKVTEALCGETGRGLLSVSLRKRLTTANYFLLAKMHDNFRKIRRNS